MLARVPPPDPTIGPDSCVLFRLGEHCNHACPMCTNTGRPDLEHVSADALLARAERLHARGVRRVVLTGGEPTIHPAFFALAERLQALGITWDLNTHGRIFHRAERAERARSLGLARAIVSLHGATASVSGAMSGVGDGAFAQTLAGVANLAAAGVEPWVNLVLSRLNLATLGDWVALCHARFGARAILKLVFPSLNSQGRDWGPIQLRLSEVREPVRAAAARARALGIRLAFEALPNCATGDPTHGDLSRSGFGETHYLDDEDGATLHAIGAIEAAHARFHDDCARCPAFDRCAGVSALYAERIGLHELVPFPRAGPWWL